MYNLKISKIAASKLSNPILNWLLDIFLNVRSDSIFDIFKER